MKRKEQSKFWVILLVLSMLFFMSGVSVFAQGNSGSFTINSGGTSVSVSSTNEDVLGDGTVSYDADSNTLTLSNAKMSNDYPNNPVIYAPNQKSLTINVVGNNEITASQAIFVTGDLTITGDGTLTVMGTTYAIYAGQDLEIKGTNVIASAAGNAGAIQANKGTVTITDSKNVTASNTNGNGIVGQGGVTITNSTVNSKVTAASGLNIGLQANGMGLEINNSNVDVSVTSGMGISVNAGGIRVTNSSTVTAATSSQYDYAFGTDGDIEIRGSKVTAAAEGAEANGMFAGGNLCICQKSEVNASGTYPALYGTSGVEISDSTVDIESSDDTGIYSPAAVTITEGSNVTAAGYWPAIRGNEGVEILGSKVDAKSSNDVAVFSPKDIKIEKSIVEAEGASDANGILSNNTVSVSDSWISTMGDETFNNTISDSVLINKENGKVIGNVTLPGDVTVPKDTILNFTDGSSLTIPKDVHFSNNGTITGDIDIQNNGQISCTNHTGGSASCTAKAICDVCNQPYGDTLSHNTILTQKVAATCTTNGKEAYYTCEKCKKNFSDAEGKNEIVTLDEYGIILATGHSWDEPEWRWSDDGKSCSVIFNCKNDSSHKETPKVIVTSEVKTQVSCTEKGVVVYTAKAAFNGKEYVNMKDVEMAPQGHKAEKTEAKKPTETEPGNIAYWYCPECRQYFEDEALTKVITQKDTVLAATGETKPELSKPEDKTDTDAAQTGDNSNMLIWVAVMLMAGTVMSGVIVCSRKRNHSR